MRVPMKQQLGRLFQKMKFFKCKIHDIHSSRSEAVMNEIIKRFLKVHWMTNNSKMNEKFKSSHPEVFCKKSVLKYSNFKGKHLSWNLFLME